MLKLITSFLVCLIALLYTVELNAQNQLHNQANLDYLESMSKKTTLTEPEKGKIRETMLIIMNEARTNPNYRKQQGCKTALNLPSNLKPFFMDDRLNNTAQEQADYQASVKNATHDNSNYQGSNEMQRYVARMDKYLKGYIVPEACGYAMTLAEFPIGWMKSETHYRPTWNLDGDKSTAVGFGVTKSANGYWYFTAVWAEIAESSAITSTHKKNLGSTPAAGTPAPVAGTSVNNQAGPSMKPGDKLLEGQKLVSANGTFQLRGTADGNFVVEDIQSGAVLHTFSLAGPINNPPSVSFLSYNPDGNICIESKQNKGYCATNGRDGVAPVILNKSERAIVTNDGRFALLNKQGQEIWSTKSRHIITKWGYVVSVNASDAESEAHTLKVGDEMFVAPPYKQKTPHRHLVQGYTYDIFAVGKGGDRSGPQSLIRLAPDPDRAAWLNVLKTAGFFKVISVSNTAIHPYDAYTLSAQQAVPNGPIQLTFEVYKEVNGKRQQLLSTFTVETKAMKWPL